MANVKGAVPKYTDQEEHLVRRLGWAVMVQWENLDPKVRDLLRDQANFTEDKHSTVQLKEQLDAFIEKHRGGK